MCVVLFIFLGDVWSLSQLKVVMLVGLGLKVPASVCLLYFKDEKALSEPEPQEPKPAEPARTQKDKTDAPVAQVEGGFRYHELHLPKSKSLHITILTVWSWKTLLDRAGHMSGV